jgi:hypothetical protein
VRAFIPHPLPPEPPLDLSGTRQRLLERATLALGRLDSITLLLPDLNLFLYVYQIKQRCGGSAMVAAYELSRRIILQSLFVKVCLPKLA